MTARWFLRVEEKKIDLAETIKARTISRPLNKSFKPSEKRTGTTTLRADHAPVTLQFQ